MADKLSREEQLQLLRFVCSFAWADAEIHAKERVFIGRLVKKMGLGAAEARQVDAWLETPPSREEVDPLRIPPAHRKAFVAAARSLIAADGQVHPDEEAYLSRVEQILAKAGE